MHKVLANLPKYMALMGAAIIALMPVHAFLTVWLASGLRHYTALRLWKEVLLFVLFMGFVALLATRPKLQRVVFRDKLWWLIIGYVLLAAVYGLVAYLKHGVSLKAYAYGLLLDTRYLVFLGCMWASGLFSDVLLRWWQRLLLIPAAVVSVIAVVQYLLPADFLRHFGYGPGTIPPTATIDQQAAYRRVQSTLRGPNPLGAYMVVILSALSVLLIRARRLHWKLVALYLFAGLALVLSFSRSAWLGVVVSIAFAIWLAIASARARRYVLLVGAAAVVAAGVTGYTLRHNARFENVFFHTSEQSRSSESSNAGHASAFRDGLLDLAHTPWGHGTGTAGPASVYNGIGQTKIAENYYVQLGQEIGLLGLLVYAVINVLVFKRLWRRRAHPLAMTLLVSFVGLVLVNMLSHAWADDTLAYIWWGLAGAALSLPIRPGSSGSSSLPERRVS